MRQQRPAHAHSITSCTALWPALAALSAPPPMNTAGLRVVFSRVLWSAEKRKQHEKNIGSTTCRESPVTHESSKIICAAASSGSCLAQHSGQCTQEPLSAPFFSQVGIEHRSSPDPSLSLSVTIVRSSASFSSPPECLRTVSSRSRLRRHPEPAQHHRRRGDVSA